MVCRAGSLVSGLPLCKVIRGQWACLTYHKGALDGVSDILMQKLFQNLVIQSSPNFAHAT